MTDVWAKKNHKPQKIKKKIFTKRKIISFSSKLFCYIVLFGISFIILYPLIEKLSTTFKSSADLVDKTVLFIPKEPSLETLRSAMGVMNYWPTLLSTVILSTAVGIIQTFICTFVAYGFARYNFPGNKILFGFVILALLIPPQVIMAPLYETFKDFFLIRPIAYLIGKPINLIGTSWPLILLSITALGLKNSLYIFMLRQFFRNMPVELEEAGLIDGAGHFRIFFQIMLPSAASMLVTVFLFAFSWQWTDDYFTTMFLGEMSILQSALSSLQTYNQATLDPVTRTALVDAGLLLVIAPLLIVYLIGQNFFVEGVTRSGIVG